jgi:hypothetical protein
MIRTSFSSFGQAVSEIIFFYKLTNQKQELKLFFLAISKISSPLKPGIQMNQNLVGTTYGRFGIKFSQSRLKGERHRLSPLSL